MASNDPETHRAYCKAYHAVHREEDNARKKAYYAAHREELLAQKRAYCAAHPDKIKARDEAYRSTHLEEIKARHKTYYETHREEDNARSKVYHSTHPEEMAAQKKAYYESHHGEMRAHNKTYLKEHSVDIICVQCGGHVKKYIYKDGAVKFCSRSCYHDWAVGPNNHRWRGSISFKPYCPKFTNALKEEVRSQFSRRCFLSGIEENGRKLAVHHCDYLKSQGCSGQRWSLLPLDHSWHSKTNSNRWYWFALLRDYWVYKYLTFHGMDIFDGPDRTAWLWEMYNNASDN